MAAERIFDLEPLNSGHNVQLSNIYASSGMWGGIATCKSVSTDEGERVGKGNWE